MTPTLRRVRKRPVEVDAIEWDGTQGCLEVLAREGCPYVRFADPDSRRLTIRTLEGDMTCDRGDVIVRGVAGEWYPVRKDIFIETYEVFEL